jgi:hypothetical protein
LQSLFIRLLLMDCWTESHKTVISLQAIMRLLSGGQVSWMQKSFEPSRDLFSPEGKLHDTVLHRFVAAITE